MGSIQAVAGPPYLPPSGRSLLPSAPSNSIIQNTSFPALSSSNGPFTVAFWFQSLNTNPGISYIVQGALSGSSQWAVIYGYTPQQVEFYTGSAAPRQNSAIPITDGLWHHIAYRKSGSGSSSWDKYLDGVKTNINPSINFTLPATAGFSAFNAASGGAPCRCSLGDVVLYATSLSDAEIQSLASGARPPSLAESPVLYWPMTGSNPEPDDSGSGNVGAIVGNIATASEPPYTGQVTISPASAQLGPSGSQQFSAAIAGGASTLSWFISPQVGSINATGLYQAPSSVTASTNVTVTGVNDANPLQYSTAAVTLNSAPPPPTAGSVLTAQYDTNRTNSNPNETILTPNNVNVNQFGKLFSLTVDGYVYAQPLYVPTSLVPALAQNTVFVATMNNTLYAFNADTGAQVWSLSLGAAQGTGYGFLAPEVGILSTPVIDPGRQVIYVVGRNSDGFRLHAIDLIAHTEKPGSPVLIQGSVPGPNGYDSAGGRVTFNASQQLQRPGLLLANNTVYVGFASIEDIDPWHGWLFGFAADTLAQTVFCTTPNGGEGGVWMGGGAPSVDQNGNIYVAVANGTYDGQTDFGQSFLKLSPTLTVLDWFTPSDYATLNADDADLGSTRAMLLPSTSLLVGGGKDGSLWLLNQGALGHLQGGAGNPPVVQTFQATTDLVTSGNETNGLWDGMAYWSTAPNGPLLYIHGSNDVLKSFRLSNGTFNTIPVAQSSTTRPFPGGVLAVSSNGSLTGILWATTPDNATNNGPSTGVLRAFDAQTLTELWNSNQNSARDSLGMFAKFSAPTVANGKVYVATFSNQVLVYGMMH
jgi:outer membrane protein assembly factor BamB